jgi:ribosomal protein S18 acetylase RimI-like enzyme
MASAGYKDALEVWNGLSPEERKLVSPRGQYVDSPNLAYRYVKKINGVPVGFIDAYNLKTGRGNSSRIAFLILAVGNQYRHQGITKEMLKKAETNLAQKGYSTMQYRVEKTNTASVATANSYGFELKNETTHQFIFEKALQNNS